MCGCGRTSIPSPDRNVTGPIWSKKMNGPTMRRRGEGSARRTWNPFPRSRVGATITSSGSAPIAPPLLLWRRGRRRRAPQRRGHSGRRDRRQAPLAKDRVHRLDLRRGQLVEFALDVVQLAAKSADAGLLIFGGLALVPQQRSIELVRVLADALLAGDGPAFFRGDDLLAHLFQLVADCREPRGQRVALGQLPGPFRGALLRGVDPIDQRAHVAEEGHYLERGLVVLAPVVHRVRRAPIEDDVDPRIEGFPRLAQPHRVR